MPLTLPPDVACMCLCLAAALIDIKTQRIPNWLTGGGVVLGLLINTLCLGWRLGLLSAFVGSFFLLLVFGFFGLLRFMGMGDVKLMAAVGAFLRWPDALWALFFVSLMGGVIAIGYALLRGSLLEVLRNLWAMVGRAVPRQKKPEPQSLALHRLPYGLAIFLGATWAALLKYFSCLRILN